MSDEVTATLARIEVRRLDERIEAARRLILSNAEMTDQERERFAQYIARLQDRRTEIEAALESDASRQALNGSDGSDGEAMTMTEARVGNLEATLRHMDERLSRLVDQIHNLDNRQQRSEDRLQRMETDQASVRSDIERVNTVLHQMQEQMRSLAAPPGYSRVYLAGGALAMTVMIVLLVLLTWRLL